MTDIDKCKALAKAGYSQEDAPRYMASYTQEFADGPKETIMQNVSPNHKGCVAVPTEIRLMEWMCKDKGLGEIIITCSDAYDGKLRYFVKTGATTEPTLSDAFLNLLDALWNLLEKMGVIE